MDDRGSLGASQKYKQSIGEFLKLAQDLKSRSDKAQQRVLKLDEELVLDPLYRDAKSGKLRDIEEFYKGGRY